MIWSLNALGHIVHVLLSGKKLFYVCLAVTIDQAHPKEGGVFLSACPKHSWKYEGPECNHSWVIGNHFKFKALETLTFTRMCRKHSSVHHAQPFFQVWILGLYRSRRRLKKTVWIGSIYLRWTLWKKLLNIKLEYRNSIM